MFAVNQKVKIDRIDSANAVVSTSGEEVVITDALKIDGDRQMVYVSFINRPMIKQRNGEFRPFAQLWLSGEQA